MAPSRVSHRSRPKTEKLSVKSVNLLKSDNQAKHHTADYESEELVVRRGIPFTLMITLSREIKSNETVEFDLRFGRRPMSNRGSLIWLPTVSPKHDEDVNGCKVLSSAGDILTIEIYTSAATTGVGQWMLVMKPHYGRRRGSNVKVTNDIIILFNPWAKADPVFMSNPSWRNEYVLNENGMQFYGTANRIGDMDWYYGQFEVPVMKACLKLLDLGRLLDRDRNDPVLVTRHLSATVNSNDDDGVLVGNWSGDYKGGKSPTFWSGSVAILKQFVDTKKPVEFGQCWVFSGVLTTVLRCIGIPARSLTTFESAHDTDGNLTIDYHFDEKGNPMDNDDSIWNFHVWNDAWMTRPLLPEGFGGWQAVDATPQEESDDKFQCGPVSVAAIKQGQVNYPYDAPFLYAEVNGSKVYWRKLKKPESGDGGKAVEWEEVGSDLDKIGQHISTKALGAFKREDITHRYKYPEGSPEERVSFNHARKFVKLTKAVRKDGPKVVEFTANVPDSVPAGKDVKFGIKVRNISKKSQVVFLSVVGKVVQYNGSIVAQVFDRRFHSEVSVSKQEEFIVNIPFKTYLRAVRSNNSLKFSFLGGVEGQSQTFATQSVIDFDKPKINIETLSAIKLLKPLKLRVSFTNPLSLTLDGGEFHVEGAGIREAMIVPTPKVKPNSLCSVEVSVTPRKLGVRRIVVCFSSKELDGLRGSIDIKVA